MKRVYLIFLLLLSICFSCKQKNPVQITVNEEKTTSVKLYAQARPGGEHFEYDMPIDQGLDQLKIIPSDEVELDDDELVLGFYSNQMSYAIPIKYLSGFEVANLFVDTNQYLLTWCPLVGSARIFEGENNGDKSGFDFGRGLVNNNLLIVDRKTNTVWNQLSCKAIEGDLKGDRLEPFPSIQSTWKFWKDKNPNSEVVINQDTTNAVFPEFVMQKPYYNKWIPGNDYPRDSGHQIQYLGLGIEYDTSSVFFPLATLFNESSPVIYELNNEKWMIHFDQNGLTAWAENEEGLIIPSTLVYDWAWKNFFPETNVYSP